MENETILDFNSESTGSLSISTVAASYMKQTAAWGKFLGILGFVFTGLMVVFGIVMAGMMQSLRQDNPVGPYLSVIYLALGVLYFFPSLYLFKYSTKMKNALETKNSEVLTQAFENEKSMYKFMGIMMIVLLGIYALAIVGGIGAAAFF